MHQKKIDINFSKAKTNVCLSLHYNSYLFVNGKEIYKFKVNNKKVSFPSHFHLASISNKYDYVELDEVSFNGNIYNFLFDYGSIDKSDILNFTTI